MNLSGPADWNSEMPFVDVFRMSRPWISQQEGKPWGEGPPLELDEHGWVKRLPEGVWAETLVCTVESGEYPSGVYTILYEGEGEVRFNGRVRIENQRPGRVELHVDSSGGAWFIQIRRTNPDNPIRNIRAIMPGFERTHRANPFHPTFLRNWRGVTVFRMMDWMLTNNSDVVTWSDRPTLQSSTFSKRGIPAELLVDLSNRMRADLWVCIPHKADDDYVRNLAQLLRRRLHPSLRLYVEYSNEVWNSQFEQARWAVERGRGLQLGGPGLRDWEYQWHYYARRSVEVFRIFEEEFGGLDRLVRVLASQSANSYVSARILAFENASRYADVLAIAPYFGPSPSPTSDPSADTVLGWGLDGLFRELAEEYLPTSLRWIREQKAVADQHGLALVAYEGGQHLVGILGAENDDRLTALFHQANADPRMGEMYAKYFEGWTEAGGGLFANFSSGGAWSKWGSWGLLQSMMENPRNSPKFMATMRWARGLGQPVFLP